MRLLETADPVCRIAVGPAVTHRAGLRGPEVHAPWKGYRRVGVARGKRMLRHRAHKDADMIHWLG